MPQRRDHFVFQHAPPIVDDDENRSVAAHVAEDVNISCVCRDAVVNQIRNRCFE